MQAHPLSTPAARTSSPSLSTLALPAPRPQASLPPTVLPPSLIVPPLGPAAHRRSFLRPAPGLQPIAQSSGLAHDAGNLLGSLQLYCELLSMPGVLSPEHRHYASDLQLIASRSSALIRRLLSTSLAAADPLVQPGAASQDAAGAAPLHPAAALRALAPVLQRIAAGAATVTVALPAALPAANLPTEALERIAVNLVRNAAEAIRSSRDTTEAPGRIRVALESTTGELRLLVEDDGPGMAPAVAAEFLNPSPLTHGATRGLGHRIVHELAAATGATLSLRVRPGRGTTFCLRWPAAEPAAQPARPLEPLHRIAPSHKPHGGGFPC
jgi:signal transduction histidine kinase